MQRLITLLCFKVGVLLLAFGPMHALAQNTGGDRYALLIGGLGGSPEHTEKFKTYLFDTRKAFIDEFQIPAENIVAIGEKNIEAEAFIEAISTSDNIRLQFDRLKASVTPNDQVFIVLFGHGGYDNGEARLNIPRRDLSQHDYAALVDQLNASRVVFINTSSASAPFIEALSGDGRIVITATRTGTQKNETSFPRFMIEAFSSPSADRDKDGRISVGEVYTFAAEKTEQMFADNANIPTENALLDDNGDQQGSRLKELANGVDGNLAGITYFSNAEGLLAAASGGAAAGWLQEKNNLEIEIANLKSQKAGLNEDEYYAQLEVLFVKLARGNAQAEGQ